MLMLLCLYSRFIAIGSLVKHQLVSSVILGQALRCVLDALRKPVDSKVKFDMSGNVVLLLRTES